MAEPTCTNSHATMTQSVPTFATFRRLSSAHRDVRTRCQDAQHQLQRCER